MRIAVLIPSYRRPRVLSLTLPSWLRGEGVRYLVVVADTPSEEELASYKQVLAEIEQNHSGIEVVYSIRKGRRGSVKARNELLKLATELNADYAVMADDDYILPRSSYTKIMALHLERNENVGAVGGRVVMLRRRRVDPDCFLNASINIADALSKATGYVFLDVANGPRYAEFLTHFYMMRRDILKLVNYDPLFESPTAFREESDVHMSIKKLGYKLVLDPRVYVLHLGLETGGDRLPSSMAQRMYWKARNHTLYICKHFASPGRRVWYLLSSTLILSIYRPWHSRQIMKGIRDGLRAFHKLGNRNLIIGNKFVA